MQPQSSSSIINNRLVIVALVVVMALVGAGAAGFGYYAYTQYQYYQPEAILKRVLTNTQDITSGLSTATIEVSANGPNVLEFTNPELSQGTKLTSYAVELDTTAVFDNEEKKWSYTVDVSADLDGQGLQAAGEFRNVEGRSYIRPINIPFFALFYDVLENRWIDVSDQVGGAVNLEELEEDETALTEEQINELVQWIVSEEFITISNVSTETVDSIEMIAFDYKLDHEKLPQFFRFFSEMISMNADDGEPAFTEADQKEAEELTEMITKEIDSIDGTALIDRQSSLVYDYSVAIDVGDISQYEISDLQILMSSQVRDINQPVDIEVPSDVLTFNEARELIDNASTELFEDQSGLDPDELPGGLPSETGLPPDLEISPDAEIPSNFAITPGM